MTDRELVGLLANAEAGNDAGLRAWLAATKPAAARRTLYHIARRVPSARQTPENPYGFLVVALLAGVGAFGSWQAEQDFLILPALFLSYIMVGAYVNTRRHSQYRDAQYAFIVLAQQGDARVLPLLASEWQANPPADRRAWNEQVTAKLLYLLDAEGVISPEYQARTQLRVIGTTLLLCPSRYCLQDLCVTQDLSVTDAYLAIAIVRFLHQVKDREAKAFVEQVAALPKYHHRQPHRAMVSEVAETLLGASSAGTASPLVAAPSVPVTVASPSNMVQRNQVP